MPYITPKYGLEVPSPSTRFRDLGIELQQMGISIEEVLESFDYNGADPNLVLSQVAALEAWRNNAEQRISDLEDDTGWISLALPSGITGGIRIRRMRGVIYFDGEAKRSAGDFPTTTSGTVIAHLPDASFRPPSYIRAYSGSYGSTTANGTTVIVSPATNNVTAFGWGASIATAYLGSLSYPAS